MALPERPVKRNLPGEDQLVTGDIARICPLPNGKFTVHIRGPRMEGLNQYSFYCTHKEFAQEHEAMLWFKLFHPGGYIVPFDDFIVYTP